MTTTDNAANRGSNDQTPYRATDTASAPKGTAVQQ
jgi:hypothetical protein